MAVFVPAGARSQPVDPQRALAAQALYEQATAEMDAKSYASACRKLEEVTRLVPEGIGAKLTLGQCYEALGRLASAWSQYALVRSQAAKAGQEERAQAADAKAAALRPRLATLTIEVPAAVRAIPGLAVTRDNVLLGEPLWGTALPIDAGGHTVETTAPGYQTSTQPVEVVADGAKVSVTIKPLKREVGETRATALAGPPIMIREPERTWQRPVGLAAMAFGGVVVAAGGVLGVIAILKNDASIEDNHCDKANQCDSTGISLRRDAVSLGNGSTVAFVAGGAALAAGVVLFTTAPPSEDKVNEKKGRPSARLVIEPGGARIEGAW